MKARCRAGHDSDETDYCSVCGKPIVLGPSVCPDCGEPRFPSDARYCEVCRYDYIEARPGPPPLAPAPVSVPVSVPVPVSAAVPASALRWELVLTVDASLDTDPDPDHPCPEGLPPILIQFDRAELLVGREDEHRDIRPEIPLPDPGASRRHAKLVREPEGGVALQDLASTNGTQLNGKNVPPGSRRKLVDGDQVTLGRWTRITLRGKP